MEMSFPVTYDSVVEIPNACQHVLVILLVLICGEMVFPFSLELDVVIKLALAIEMWVEVIYIISRKKHLKANVRFSMFFAHEAVIMEAYIELKMPSDNSTQEHLASA